MAVQDYNDTIRADAPEVNDKRKPLAYNVLHYQHVLEWWRHGSCYLEHESHEIIALKL